MNFSNFYIFKGSDLWWIILVVTGGLYAAAGLERPIAVLHGADVPTFRGPVELQLERLVGRDLILVRCHVNTWKQWKITVSFQSNKIFF